ncbi:MULTISPECIES: ribonuclease T2 family protein [unclassified Meridianimarinicoccus]|uniref:ribonuclease T2 family protein n=1 Tax=unclassified Meridianimarinicoccus TaxID=2923344 RepID=UPI001866258D|nr:ribonuclease T2 [Fluviibacterium sp. MJW13]
MRTAAARGLVLSMALLSLLSGAARADHDRPGVFDYYVLSLSWSPNWCLREGDARDAEQCDTRHDHGWLLHGLWPQHEDGYPKDCHTDTADPTRAQSGAMTDIMGSGGLAWYQWKKHGRCTGLSGPQYYALSREAYGRITRPELLRKLDKTVKLPATVIEEAFLEVNPALSAAALTITCRDGMIQEARICLTRDLDPRPCGDGVSRDCSLDDALFAPIR